MTVNRGSVRECRQCADRFVNQQASLVTNQQDGTGKHPASHAFLKNVGQEMRCFHTDSGGRAPLHALSGFPAGGQLLAQLRAFGFLFIRRLRVILHFQQPMEGAQRGPQALKD